MENIQGRQTELTQIPNKYNKIPETTQKTLSLALFPEHEQKHSKNNTSPNSTKFTRF